MKLFNFNIIKITLSLLIGIILSHYFQLNFNIVSILTLLLVFLIGIIWAIQKDKIYRRSYFGILVYLCFMCIGMTAYNIKNEKSRSTHYTNFDFKNEGYQVHFKICERLKPDNYNQKYIAELIQIDNRSVSGKILVNISLDSSTNSFGIDYKLASITSFQDIQKPLNPHQFDYSEYLELKHVYQQVYLKPTTTKILSSKRNTIYGFADALRSRINEKLDKAGFQKNILSIINALLLGQRQTINKSIYNNYVNSGTIHILAVSGLHVGIILWILNFIFRPLLHIKYGRVFRPLIIVTLSWCFAIITGLSPSVTRAVTMFSVISVAMHYKRPTNIYNTLFISAFLILLFKPRFLFEVGFQLSYLAVFGIVSIQPLIYKIWKPKYILFDKLWQIFTVTLAAQIGVVPISLYYFHQFPGLFFVSNLIIIPFLSLILGLGLLIIVFGLLDLLNSFMVKTYSLIIVSMNNFIAWISQFESFLLRDIPFTAEQVIITYLIIIGFVQAYKYKKVKWIPVCLVGIICFQGLMIYYKNLNRYDSFLVLNKSRYSIIVQKYNDRLTVHHNLDSSLIQNENTITNYKVGENIENIEMDSLKSVFQFKDKLILAIDSLSIYNSLSFKPNYILLRNSPKINLNRVIDSLNPELIIADASNYKSYAKRWKTTCQDRKIPFHYTNEKGAFILK